MALKEGRCPNCGSILNLDSQAEKGHCLFCDAVFENKTAFEIAQNPSGYEFPNEPQPKYEGPSLQPGHGSAVSGGSGQKKKKPAAANTAGQEQSQEAKRKPRKAPPKAYVHREPIKLPDTKLPPAFRRKLIIAAIVIVLVIAGVSTPLVISRDNMRADLLASLPDYTPFEVDPDSDAVIRQLNNAYLMVVAPEAISEEDMIRLFKGFAEERAQMRGFDQSDFRRVYRPVTVKVLTPEGGYLLSRPQSPETLESGVEIVPIG